MNINIGDRLIMKKQHPCGNKEFEVFRVGMDFKLRCTKCGHEILAPRSKIEKNIKQIIQKESVETDV